jgi:hypothetical protein
VRVLDDTGGIISYEDACDRVGRELFGDEWDITLSDDEWSEYDAGPWAASSTIAYWDAAQKIMRIEQRERRVDAWLAERDLIDGFTTQFRLPIPAISRSAFDAAFADAFRAVARGLSPKERLSDRGAADCKRWLEDLVRSSPDRNPMGSKKATSFQAKGKFGVSGYQFYRLWNEVMKAQPGAKWTKPRRRSDSTSGHGG